MEYLKQGTRIKFDFLDEIGFGTIVGRGSMGGETSTTYIIHPDKPLKNAVNQYTHFVVSERHLQVLEVQSEPIPFKEPLVSREEEPAKLSQSEQERKDWAIRGWLRG